MSQKIKKNPRVGIFMPVYNTADYVEEAIRSALSQTYNDLVLHVADDASTDGKTHEILKKINDPRCKIFFEKINMGQAKISNKYMSKMDVEYIVLFNSDDKMDPDYINQCVEELDRNPHLSAICSWVQCFDGADDLYKYTDELCTLPHMLLENQYCGAALMRKQVFIESGMHDTSGKIHPNIDWDLWLTMLSRGYSLGVIPEPLFFWRIRPTSLSHDMSMESELEFRAGLTTKHAELYRQYGDYLTIYFLSQQLQYAKDYEIYNEGHAWLDSEYKRLVKENDELKSRLHELENMGRRSHIKRALGIKPN